jgi:uncharacterized membrane protein (UPF0127 family)
MMRVYGNNALSIRLGVAFILLVSLAGCAKDTGPKACFKGRCFYLELAQTPQEQLKGLMFRESLDRDKGMLFVFKFEGKHSFWMKNTLIALDIIWIDNEGEVVFIKRGALPCLGKVCPSIYPDKKATYVLELNAGVADDVGLKVGDKVSLYLSED